MKIVSGALLVQSMIIKKKKLRRLRSRVVLIDLVRLRNNCVDGRGAFVQKLCGLNCRIRFGEIVGLFYWWCVSLYSVIEISFIFIIFSPLY